MATLLAATAPACAPAWVQRPGRIQGWWGGRRWLPLPQLASLPPCCCCVLYVLPAPSSMGPPPD